MMMMRSSFAISLLLIGVVVEGFTVPHARRSSASFMHATKSNSVPEYSVEEEFERDNEDAEVDQMVQKDAVGIAEVSTVLKPTPKPSAVTSAPAKSPKLQYAAMEPGTVVHIQVGDISLARKAWKKRRRSGSPLLVPCSVLTVDRQSTIRWNLIYLLEKFGASHEGGIRISLADLTRRHRKHLQSSLTQHAEAMGYGTAKELVEGLFNKQVQETYGVKLILGTEENENSDTLWLQAPLSRFRAQKRAGKAAVLQFSDDQEDDTTLRHTGIVRNRNEQTAGDATDASNNNNNINNNLYKLRPLSAALRVGQDDVDAGTIQNGSMHAAVVFDYDSAGDAGAPLITLSLNPARNQVRDRLKIVDQREVIRNPKYMLSKLGAGEGPIKGKVVRLIKGGALVDCSVGRPKASHSEDVIKVYGLLRFQDAVKIDTASSASRGYNFDDLEDYEDDDEEEEEDEDGDWNDIMSSVNDDIDDEDSIAAASAHLIEVLKELDNDEEFADSEDITHMFDMDEDGSLTYTDPESGEAKVIDLSDDEEEEEEEAEVKIPNRKAPAGFGKTRRSRQRDSGADLISSSRPLFMHVGDEIDVYVKSVSKQSKQFLLTLDSTVQGRNAKDLKKEGEVNKKLSRLAKQLGGMHRIEQLRGQQYDGIIKATSNAGDWLYVQPTTSEQELALPVGIATAEEDLGVDLKQGDAVRIQIEGVDEDRGQLALRVLQKL